eukprot:scaffold103122_cov48-Cyclotella_meneghiniana.AAC.5
MKSKAAIETEIDPCSGIGGKKSQTYILGSSLLIYFDTACQLYLERLTAVAPITIRDRQLSSCSVSKRQQARA